MSEVKVFPESEFPTIHCTKLIVHPVTTYLKWNTSRRHPGIEILGFIDTAKSLATDTPRGILANTGYLIGGDEASWHIVVNEASGMYFGAALSTQDLTDIENVAVKRLIDVKKNDRVCITLTHARTIIMRHEKYSGRLVNSYIFDITPFNDQMLYPWVSTKPGGAMYVKILKDVEFMTDVRSDGLVRMKGSQTDIIDFNLDGIYSNNGLLPGDGPITDSITNTVSGASVKATDGGELDMCGGIKYKCENITATVATYILNKDQKVVTITNPVITSVQLPEAADAGKCRVYTILRNYSLQPGETWQNPALRVIPNPGDTIELDSWIGLPPHTNVELLSDAINDWRVV